jgi:hypothetical protein
MGDKLKNRYKKERETRLKVIEKTADNLTF